MSAVMLRNASDISGYLGDMGPGITHEDEDIMDVMESIKSHMVDNRLARYNPIIYLPNPCTLYVFVSERLKTSTKRNQQSPQGVSWRTVRKTYPEGI